MTLWKHGASAVSRFLARLRIIFEFAGIQRACCPIKARDQGRVFANIQRIKDRRGVHAPHVALVCHPGKDPTRGPRGSNASTGDFDVQIEIADTDIRTATVTKANDGPEGYLASFKP
jgi:hypothetical protein